MPRYIDAIKLLKEFQALPCCRNGYSDEYDKARIFAMIDNQPTADVVERKKGKLKKGKKFIGIVAEYLPNCPYPKYEGKPYFSIRYEENGEKYDGFGTYNPEVLSEYIREYFIGADMRGDEDAEIH